MRRNRNKKYCGVSKRILACAMAGCIVFGYGGNVQIPQVYAADTTTANTYTDGQGITYTLNTDGTCAVSGYTENLKSEIVIPAMITVNGKKYSVTRVKEYVFIQQNEITSVTIEKGVTVIERGAFCFCSNLTSVSIPSSITSMGDSLFYNCTSLKNVELQSGLTSIGECMFSGCTSLTSVNIPSGVTSIGEYAFQKCSSLTDVNIPDGVTRIGMIAFSDCSSLRSLQIPDGVTSIGYAAFKDCTSLVSIYIPGSVVDIGEDILKNVPTVVIYGTANSTAETYAKSNLMPFAEYHFESEYTDNQGVKYGINGDGTCEVIGNTGKLNTELVIPATITADKKEYSVTGIGPYAFYYCSHLSKVKVSEGITSIGKYAFYSCKSLCDVQLPDSVVSIGTRAFSACGELNRIKIPESVMNIGDNAFLPDYFKYVVLLYGSQGSVAEQYAAENGNTFIAYDDASIYTDEQGISYTLKTDKTCEVTDYTNELKTDIVIPETIVVDGTRYSVTGIGRYAFAYSTDLFTINIPESVTGIGEYAFLECSSLTDITVNNKNQAYMSYDGVLYNKGGDALLCCPAGKEVFPTILTGVTMIGNGAFEGCSNFTNISIPDTVKSIGENAFFSCSGVAAISIPEGVASIGDGAFAFCENLISINIPFGVTRIEDNLFYSCDNLTSINISENVKSIGEHSFFGCSKLKDISIPEGVTSIEGYAFSSCLSLASIHIPKSVISMGRSVFLSANRVVIYGEPGSQAEVYAQKYRISFVDRNSIIQSNQPETPEAGVPSADAGTSQAGTPQTVTVTPAATQGITLNKTSRNMYVGETFTLKAAISPENAASKAVTYKSSKPSVAAVDANGKVTAKKRGTTVITVAAQDGSGIVAKCTIRVGYRIVYKLNGGKNNTKNPSAYTTNANVKLASPSRAGYTFKGWYTTKSFKSGSKVTTISKKSKGKVTLYAKWEKVKKPGKASLKTVKSSKSGTVTVTAKKGKSVSGYEIIVATDKKFKKNVKTVTIRKTTASLSGLQKGKTYYIKVRTYKLDSANNKVYGTYSSMKTVKVKK